MTSIATARIIGLREDDPPTEDENPAPPPESEPAPESDPAPSPAARPTPGGFRSALRFVRQVKNENPLVLQGQPGNYTRWLEKAQGGREWNGYRRRKLANNTYLLYDPHEQTVAIRLHQTNVLTFKPDGSVKVRTGGWETMTTLARINEYLPPGWRVFSVKREWKWSCRGEPGFKSYYEQLFSDGDVIDGEGYLRAQEKARPRLPSVRRRLAA